MNQDHLEDGARRALLQRSLATGLGIAIVWAVGRPALAAGTKLAKEAVQYTDHGTVEGKDCDDCSQYIAGASANDPASCKVVDGPISPHGHCIAFSPKPKS